MLIRSPLRAVALVAVALLAVPSFTFAGSLVGSRAALNTLLGAGATTETFEAYPIADGTANVSTTTQVLNLNASTIFNGVGPGLINSALSIDTPGNLQWNGANYFGQPSRDILSNNQTITVNFLGGTGAFGIDLLAYNGYDSTATAIVKDQLGNTLDSFSNLLLDGTQSTVVPTFFGYTDAGGIGSVTFTSVVQSWSPIIDNLTFGPAPASVVPEPSTIASAALAVFAGLGTVISRRRRASR